MIVIQLCIFLINTMLNKFSKRETFTCLQIVYNHFFNLKISKIVTTDITIRPNAQT